MADGLLQALWAQANKPTLPQPAQLGASLEDQMSQPKLDESPMMARIRGFGAGATKGVGNVLSDATSPITLLTLLATMGGSAGLGAGARGLGEAGSALRGASELAPELGQISAEFTPATKAAQATYNAGRAIPKAALDPEAEAQVSKYLAKLASEKGAVSPDLLMKGVGGAGAGYLGWQAIKYLMDKANEATDTAKKVNPFSAISDKLNSAAKR